MSRRSHRRRRLRRARPVRFLSTRWLRRAAALSRTGGFDYDGVRLTPAPPRTQWQPPTVAGAPEVRGSRVARALAWLAGLLR